MLKISQVAEPNFSEKKDDHLPGILSFSFRKLVSNLRPKYKSGTDDIRGYTLFADDIRRIYPKQSGIYEVFHLFV